MGNPFQVKVGEGWGRGLSGLADVLDKVGEKREAKAKEQKALETSQQAGVDLMDAFEAKDYGRIGKIFANNPQLSSQLKTHLGVMETGNQLETDRRSKEQVDFMRDVLTSNPDDIPAKYERRIKSLSAQGGDPAQTAQNFQDYMQRPEEELEELKLIYAASASPAEFKAFEKQMETPDFEQGTGNMSGFIFNSDTGQYKKSELKPATGPDQKQINVLRKDIFNLTKPLREVETAYAKMVNAEDTAAGDMSLIFSYMKMLDPGSTVREGEYATAQNTTGIPGRIINAYNQSITGERLNETQKSEFLSQSKGLYEAQRVTADSAIENILQQADQDDIARDRVFGTERLSGFNQRRKSSGKGASTLPSTNSQGWILNTDANGNQAYVGPNGEVEEI